MKARARRHPILLVVAMAVALVVGPLPLIGASPAGAASADAYVLTTTTGAVAAFGSVSAPAAPRLPDTVDLVVVDAGAGVHRLSANGTIVSSATRWVPGNVPTAGWGRGETAVAMVMTPTESGAWIVTTAGRVVPMGDAVGVGGVSSIALAAPIIDAASTGTGGLYLLGGDGGIFTLGTAQFHGSVPQVLPGVTLDKPLVGIVVTASGRGYWLVAADGGLFAFGDAPFVGSVPAVLPGVTLNAPVVGAVSYGNGYLMVAGDGGVFTFSNLAFVGSLGDNPPADAVVAISPVRALPTANAVISIWHDSSPDFGHLGVPQRWVNVQGNVSDPDGIATVQYRLRGGAWTTMQLGADTRRLTGTGHFNIDLAVSALRAGPNTLEIRVTDPGGRTTTTTTTVTWTSGVAAPINTTVNWATVSNPSSVAQPVDGQWRVVDGWLNNVDDGYDRTIAIGDRTWTGYEVTVPVVLNSILPDADDTPSNGPGLGLALRWNGHNDSVLPGSQPQVGFLPDGKNPSPFGAILFWRDATTRPPAFELYDERNGLRGTDASLAFMPGTTYVFKAQVRGAGPTTYRWRIWKQGTAEPSTWNIEFTTPGRSTEPSSGSVALIAHEVDANFGTVTIRPL